MQRYVKEVRLLVGPFYVGSDWTLTSGAAQIHNFYEDKGKVSIEKSVEKLISLCGSFPGKNKHI